MAAGNTRDRLIDAACPLPNDIRTRTEVDLVDQACKVCEAVRLVELGARARLVHQLSGLEKKAVNRLYYQLMGRPSPSGQTPFSDSWYRQSDRRMAHANMIWRLDQHLTHL